MTESVPTSQVSGDRPLAIGAGDSASGVPLRGEKKPPWLNTASAVSLFIGLVSVSASLYVFHASRPRPGLVLDRYPSVTYASTEMLTGLGEVSLTVAGQKIDQIRSIAFNLRNVGNAPVSSIPGTAAYNLVSPIALDVTPEGQYRQTGRLLAIQPERGAEGVIQAQVTQSQTGYRVELAVAHLNRGQSAGFTMLLGDFGEPDIALRGNPLIGGAISTNLTGPRASTTWWSGFKRNTFPGVAGALLMAPFPIVLVILVVGARRLQRELKQRDMPFYHPEYEKAQRVQQQHLDRAIQAKIDELPPQTIKTLSATRVEYPVRFESAMVSTSLIDLIRPAYTEKWAWTFQEQYPIPADVENLNQSYMARRVSTPWYSWGDFLSSAVVRYGLPAALLAAGGASLLFL